MKSLSYWLAEGCISASFAGCPLDLETNHLNLNILYGSILVQVSGPINPVNMQESKCL